MEYNDTITWFPPDAPYSPQMNEVLQCTIDTITFRGSFIILPQFLPFETIFIKNKKWYYVKITEIMAGSSPDILKLRYTIVNEFDGAKNPDLGYDYTAIRIQFIQRHCWITYKQSQIARRKRGDDVEIPDDKPVDDQDDSDDPYCGFIPPGVSYDETDGKYYYDDSESEGSFHCGCPCDPYPDDPYGGHTPPGFDYDSEPTLRKTDGYSHREYKKINKSSKSNNTKEECRQTDTHKHRLLREEITEEINNEL